MAAALAGITTGAGWLAFIGAERALWIRVTIHAALEVAKQQVITIAAHDIQEAWPESVLGEPRDLPWGNFAGRDVLAIYTNELTVHTWDLARATGQQPEWDEQVLQVSWDAIRFQLPDPVRGPMWAQARQYLPEGEVWEDPFADAVAMPEDAPLIERLVGWNGRRP